MAKIASTATFTSVTSSRSGSFSRPNSVVSVPKGITENAANAVTAEMTGASRDSSVSADLGRRSSLKSSLMTSANGWSSPSGPTRLGPDRSWM